MYCMLSRDFSQSLMRWAFGSCLLQGGITKVGQAAEVILYAVNYGEGVTPCRHCHLKWAIILQLVGDAVGKSPYLAKSSMIHNLVSVVKTLPVLLSCSTYQYHQSHMKWRNRGSVQFAQLTDRLMNANNRCIAVKYNKSILYQGKCRWSHTLKGMTLVFMASYFLSSNLPSLTAKKHSGIFLELTYKL